MEARIARLEADVTNLRTHMAEVKAEIRTLRDKMDAITERFDDKLDTLRERIGAVKNSMRATT
jgi:uncharacterized coiled-coil protein SlyX